MYTTEPAVSGVYVAVRVAGPRLNDPAGTSMVALPWVRVVGGEVKLPAVSVTEPVGIGPPATLITTGRV